MQKRRKTATPTKETKKERNEERKKQRNQRKLRGNEATKKRGNEETKKRRNKETRRRGSEETKKQRNEETKKQRNEETKKWGNKEMKEMRNEDTKKWENEEMKETRKLRNEETRERKKQRGRRKQRNKGHEETKKARKWGNEDTMIFFWSHVFLIPHPYGPLCLAKTMAFTDSCCSKTMVFSTLSNIRPTKSLVSTSSPLKIIDIFSIRSFFDPNIVFLIPDPYGPLCLAKTLVFAALLQSNVAKPWYSRNLRTFVWPKPRYLVAAPFKIIDIFNIWNIFLIPIIFFLILPDFFWSQ